MKSDVGTKFIQTTFQGRQPTANDFNGAQVAINRLINAYLFPIEDVMIGKFFKLLSEMAMKVNDKSPD